MSHVTHKPYTNIQCQITVTRTTLYVPLRNYSRSDRYNWACRIATVIHLPLTPLCINLPSIDTRSTSSCEELYVRFTPRRPVESRRRLGVNWPSHSVNKAYRASTFTTPPSSTLQQGYGVCLEVEREIYQNCSVVYSVYGSCVRLKRIIISRVALYQYNSAQAGILTGLSPLPSVGQSVCPFVL